MYCRQRGFFFYESVFYPWSALTFSRAGIAFISPSSFSHSTGCFSNERSVIASEQSVSFDESHVFNAHRLDLDRSRHV
ncbi:MAG: hypothetical protein M3O50_02640, partial [Myxococcota bacterium]|nr:hypothetical protein [Myxococcota bacterium]